MVAADGPKEYEVAFEAMAGTEQQTLQPGSVAYIGTGQRTPLLFACNKSSQRHAYKATKRLWHKLPRPQPHQSPAQGPWPPHLCGVLLISEAMQIDGCIPWRPCFHAQQAHTSSSMLCL